MYIVRALIVAPALCALSFNLYAQCSAEDISSYVQSGASAEQLRQLCGQQMQQNSQPDFRSAQIARVCMTQRGPCWMGEQLPIGAYCVCYTPNGALSGIAR
jgi:hypothetical protein